MLIQHVPFLAYVSAYVSGDASYVFPYVLLQSAYKFNVKQLDFFIGIFFKIHIYIYIYVYVYIYTS